MYMSRRCQDIKKMMPVYKNYLWGGISIKNYLGKDTPYPNTAESWELSVHKDGVSMLDDGTPFDEYISSLSAKSLGTDYNPTKPFPLLIKYIDAGDNLSIQVHPDDEYAKKVENDNGKDEMWYIVSAKPGAFIYIGWKEDTNREEVKNRLENNTIEELLNKIYVKPGDSFFIEAGTVHAIGKGCLVAEIQQSSNISYRLYDYGRLGGDGKPRELHISKALDVLKYAKYEAPAHASFGLLAMCPTFKVRKHEIWLDYEIKGLKESFIVAMIVKGEGLINRENTKIGDTWFISSGQKIKLIGNMTVLTVTI